MYNNDNDDLLHNNDKIFSSNKDPHVPGSQWTPLPRLGKYWDIQQHGIIKIVKLSKKPLKLKSERK